MLLTIAAVLLGITGLLHSVLGERYILRRLAKLENLPRLRLGTHEMMLPVLRFAWHITSFFMVGFAFILALMANGKLNTEHVASVLAATFLACFVVSAVASKGRHMSWVVFLFVGGASLYVAIG